MYGPNGCGKTTFTLDCLRANFDQMPIVYIDCVEYYSEKLISTYISIQLNAILPYLARKSGVEKKFKKKFKL